jgi:hypothetical protein
MAITTTEITEQSNALLARLNAAVAAVNEAEKIAATVQTELISRSKTVGLLLLEAKKLHPAVKDFEAFLKKVNGLKRSRAYDLLRLAGGRTTDEELRRDARDRKRKSREKKLAKGRKLPQPAPEPEPQPVSVTDHRVTESPEISIEPLPIRGHKKRLDAENAAVMIRGYMENVADLAEQNPSGFDEVLEYLRSDSDFAEAITRLVRHPGVRATIRVVVERKAEAA